MDRESIHYAQSTVSAQIMALEEDLGIRLFERLGRRIVLTDVSKRFYLYACKMLEIADAARAEMAEGERMADSLTIRAPESFCLHRLPPVLTLFRKRMPNIKLNFITCAQEGLQQDLAKGITDLAFLLADSIHSKNLVAEMLGTEHLAFVEVTQLMVWHQDKWLTPFMKAFIDTIRELLKSSE